jgi:hypothetical protein
MKGQIDLLDALVPLRGASFGDAVAADVDVPLRYLEFYVRLGDGKAVRLRDSRQFLGCNRSRSRTRFYFRAGAEVIGIGPVTGWEHDSYAIERWSPNGTCRAISRRDPGVQRLGDCVRLTATDGGLLFIACAEAVPMTASLPPKRTHFVLGFNAVRIDETIHASAGR